MGRLLMTLLVMPCLLGVALGSPTPFLPPRVLLNDAARFGDSVVFRRSLINLQSNTTVATREFVVSGLARMKNVTLEDFNKNFVTVVKSSVAASADSFTSGKYGITTDNIDVFSATAFPAFFQVVVNCTLSTNDKSASKSVVNSFKATTTWTQLEANLNAAGFTAGGLKIVGVQSASNASVLDVFKDAIGTSNNFAVLAFLAGLLVATIISVILAYFGYVRIKLHFREKKKKKGGMDNPFIAAYARRMKLVFDEFALIEKQEAGEIESESEDEDESQTLIVPRPPWKPHRKPRPAPAPPAPMGNPSAADGKKKADAVPPGKGGPAANPPPQQQQQPGPAGVKPPAPPMQAPAADPHAKGNEHPAPAPSLPAGRTPPGAPPAPAPQAPPPPYQSPAYQPEPWSGQAPSQQPMHAHGPGSLPPLQQPPAQGAPGGHLAAALGPTQPGPGAPPPFQYSQAPSPDARLPLPPTPPGPGGYAPPAGELPPPRARGPLPPGVLPPPRPKLPPGALPPPGSAMY